MMSQRPSAVGTPLVPVIAGRPFYGIEPVIMDDGGQIVADGGDLAGAAGASGGGGAAGKYNVLEGPGEGSLCIEQPWPGMARTIYGDDERFLDTYYAAYPGLYLTGDACERREDGMLRITGRIDDVINIAGHRLSTAEVESVMSAHEDVAEAAVIGCDDETKGEKPFAFVVLKGEAAQPGNDGRKAEVVAELKERVRDGIAKFAVPDEVVVSDALPKTRAGKIMRRILRKVAAGNEDGFGDTSTLADPAAVEAVVASYRSHTSE